jgi:diguanylate cyclase (GGDEF)-like protein
MDDATTGFDGAPRHSEAEETTLLKRRLYAAYLIVTGALVTLLRVFVPGWSESGGGPMALAPLVLVVALLGVLVLGRSPAGKVAAVERSGYWASYPVLLGALVLTLTSADAPAGARQATDAFAVWMPLASVWAFLAFGPVGGAIGASAFLVATALTLGTLGAAGVDIGGSWLAVAAPLLGTGTVFLGGLFVVSALLERQAQSRATAEVLAASVWRDALTGLASRLAFEARFEQARALARRGGGMLAVYFVDIDAFKDVNDTLGHRAGDVLLRRFAERLRRTVRESDTVARIGGDEFVVLAFVQDAEQAAVLADKLAAIDDVRFERGGREVVLESSVGVSLFPRDGEDGSDLLDRADRAMYEVKVARARRRALERADAARPIEDATPF